MSDLPFFNFFHGDYLADTGHLDTIEHGAYLLIMLDYYKHRQGPKADPKTLAKLTKMSPKRWLKISDTILEYFQTKDGRLWQKRAEKEIQKMLQTHGKLSEQGRRGAIKRWGTSESPANSPAIAPPPESQWQPESDSKALKPIKKKINKKESEPQKIQHAEFVTMTEEQHGKLQAIYGPEKTAAAIDRLSNYKGSSGKKYKSDYHAILSWVMKEVEIAGPQIQKEEPTNCPKCGKESSAWVVSGGQRMCLDCSLVTA